MKNDPINHPSHYTAHPSGVETIDLNENMPANLAAAFKYLTRFKHKGHLWEDLEKCQWYLWREFARQGHTRRAVERDKWLRWLQSEADTAVIAVADAIMSASCMANRRESTKARKKIKEAIAALKVLKLAQQAVRYVPEAKEQ